MEIANGCSSRSSRKRRLLEEEEEGDGTLDFSLDDVNEDLLERVLSWLPALTLFRIGSVCKRWRSVAGSESFKLACSRIPSRDPWFFMVDSELNQSVVFDSAERSWKRLNHPHSLLNNRNRDSIPVAASGGLVCFRNTSGGYIVCNPVTGLCRELPTGDSDSQGHSLNAIAMNAYSNYHGSYKLVLVSGDLPKLSFKVYNSTDNCWEEEIILRREADGHTGSDLNDDEDDSNIDDDAVYFLSKAGNVVVTNMQRSPSKQYSSVFTLKDGEEIVYFLSSSGKVTACNLTLKCFSEYPRLLPLFTEYSIDVVECKGEMLVVVLSEFFESASLRVWRYDPKTKTWNQVAAMPPAMSHEFYDKKLDINCVGAGDQIFICLSSAELCSYVLYDFATNRWIELPKSSVNGEALEFVSAFSFEPRIEASV
ncbi:F-box only protein 13 [Hibiscus syriacus]|uniref:F-box only protein 13 n=1 Tax=Hibiscus syriacus TaxID=106335 RepID=A0A6A2XNF0_HIBSY|nr:F-box only protein 13-like [Hibiscus syriacus]XP_039030324.1 F-box only protein 13-like [Hibiscus syriacus]KAE8677128.1 F-box only protein 13 [Hibiscus syriacus]